MAARIARWAVVWLLALGPGLGLVGCGSGGDDPAAAPFADLERATFDLVNGLRAEQGLTALAWNDTVAAVCRRHSQDMAEGKVPFGHDGFYDRVDELGRSFDLAEVAENVHYNYGYDDPARVALDGWAESAGHRANMLGDYTLSGLGVAEAEPGEYFFTQLFLREQ